jgi:hypothetical protein
MPEIFIQTPRLILLLLHTFKLFYIIRIKPARPLIRYEKNISNFIHAGAGQHKK